MNKGIGPRGLGAVKSPAKQTKNHSMKYQKHLEAGIRNEYGQQLNAKRKEIKDRTYREAGIYDFAGDKSSKEYKQMVNVANDRVDRRMMNNKGPKAIRAERDAKLSESRATFDAMPSTISRRRANEKLKGGQYQYNAMSTSPKRSAK